MKPTKKPKKSKKVKDDKIDIVVKDSSVRGLERIIARVDGAYGGPTWESVGYEVYRKEGSYVWKAKDGWWRTDLPAQTMAYCLGALGLGPQGLFSQSSGPYKTLLSAKRGRRCQTSSY